MLQASYSTLIFIACRILTFIRITYLNRDYTRSSTGIEFYQESKTTTINDAWHVCSNTNELEFKTALRQGRAGTLNVYLCDVYAGSNGAGTAGYAYLPTVVQGQTLFLDGVLAIGFNLVNAMGFPTDDTAVRATLSHEVGHWVSHLHVHQSSLSFAI
jgi:hypothetical protein